MHKSKIRKYYRPSPLDHINIFFEKLKNQYPFTFIRFSDGEIEILRNRYLEISNGETTFRGRISKNKYPELDSKRFDPVKNMDVREDLLLAAMHSELGFYKGIPTSHNLAYTDKHFMVRLNGGVDGRITFADLFLNSNYDLYRSKIVPFFSEYPNTYVVCNYRAELKGCLKGAVKISVNDNFFLDYQKAKYSLLSELEDIPYGSLVLSSASSLTKIAGYHMRLTRKDVTFLDIGTSINDCLSLPSNIRNYLKRDKLNFKSRMQEILINRHNIKW